MIVDRICSYRDFYGGWVHKGIVGKMKGGECSRIRCQPLAQIDHLVSCSARGTEFW
jgi:hypothetical protein